MIATQDTQLRIAPPTVLFWVFALIVGVTPIVMSCAESRNVGASAGAAEVRSLIQLAQVSRATVAQLRQERATYPLQRDEQLRTRAAVFERLRTLSPLMAESGRLELAEIDRQWSLLQASLSRGEVTGAQSFATHTHLLDRLTALSGRLVDDGI